MLEVGVNVEKKKNHEKCSKALGRFKREMILTGVKCPGAVGDEDEKKYNEPGHRRCGCDTVSRVGIRSRWIARVDLGTEENKTAPSSTGEKKVLVARSQLGLCGSGSSPVVGLSYDDVIGREGYA